MRVTRQLFLTGTKVDALISSIARRSGLSHVALNALAVIEAGGGPMPVGQVTAQMHITTATTTTVLDTLERKGYVRRIPDATDRRKVLVDITPDAQSLLDEVLPAVQRAAGEALRDFDDAALQHLLDTLTRVVEAIDGLPDELPPARRRSPARLRRS
jgi:DNA-binding MarR family transcriptional regulator